MLEKHLNIPAADIDRGAIDGFLLVCRKIKPDTAKQRIWLLKAAWDWGRDKFQLPDLNPWEGVAERFKSVPVQPVPAFSTDEVKRILDGFRNSPHYANYLDYVRFRLSMATRPQEVRDLKWKHISADFGSAWFASNKTKKGRTVPLDPSIASMLSTRRDLLKPASDDELVFTSREGLPIDNGNFRRLWRIVLAEVGVPYRKPYPSVLNPENFIDLPPHSLKNGLNIKEIESWNAHQKYWLSIYQLLCGFQIEGKINLELLPAWYYPDLKGEISLSARRLIVIYKILKLGWSDLEKHFPLGKCGYNVMFQKILQSKSAHLLKKSSIKIIDRPRTQLDYLRELRDRKAELSAIDREILSRKFLGNNFDTSRQIHLDNKHIFGNDMFIKHMFGSTQNSDIKKLLVELDKLNEDVKTSAIKTLNRKNDKNRTRRFEEKRLKFLSKTLDPDSIDTLKRLEVSLSAPSYIFMKNWTFPDSKKKSKVSSTPLNPLLVLSFRPQSYQNFFMTTRVKRPPIQ